MPEQEKYIRKFNAYYMGLRLRSDGKLHEYFKDAETGKSLVFSKRRGKAPTLGLLYPFKENEDKSFAVPHAGNFIRGGDRDLSYSEEAGEWRDLERADKLLFEGLKFKPKSNLQKAMDTIETELTNMHHARRRRVVAWILKELIRHA